jgi:hypothetical protein
MTQFSKLAACAALFLSVTAVAATTHRPVESIHDLPSSWTGVAGGFLTKTPATFTIGKVLKVEREDRDGRFAAVYDVEATLSFGTREIKVSKIGISRYETVAENYEVMLTTCDELAGNMLASIHYDEASDSFTFNEIPHYGERRFALSAPAPRRLE